MHPERREAVEATFHSDIRDAIEFLSMLTFKVRDNEFDEEFGPEVKAVVYHKPDGTKAVAPAKGFKGYKGPLDSEQT
jgi:hypothetical protein